MGVQVDSSGKVHYIDSEGDEGGWWNYVTKHLPRAVGGTFGEAITPSLTPIGSGGGGRDLAQVQSGPEWIRANTEATGNESPAVAGLKGGLGEAQARLTPGTGIDFQAALLGEASGGVLAGAGAAAGAASRASKAKDASTAARKSATQKLQTKAKAEGGGGYHTQRAATKARSQRPQGIQDAEDITDSLQAEKADDFLMRRIEGREGGGHVAPPEQLGPSREMAERAIYDRARSQATTASPMEVSMRNRGETPQFSRGEPVIPGEPPAASGASPPLPPMGTPADLADLVYSEEIGRAAAQMKALVKSPQGGNVIGLMQDLLSQNPSITFGQFLAQLNQGGGRFNAPTSTF